MEITYTKHGDYLLPDLTLKETKKGNINKYGKMRLAYLKDYKKAGVPCLAFLFLLMFYKCILLNRSLLRSFLFCRVL